jgi:esterase/lipase superfamily enzyme
VFIHGYDNTPPIILQRQRILKIGLATAGFKGTVVSFDWPSGDVALSYLPDREKAKQTAWALVRGCIELFLGTQAVTECDVNVHILAHSTGAYVVREAFDDSDDRSFQASINWTVSQLVLIAGDISATSMSEGNASTQSIYRHCICLTNYSNPYDEVLQLSNHKRFGADPRVGRVRLPADAPSTAANVDCGEYFQVMINTRDAKTIIGYPSHSWHIGDPVFTKGLAYTLNGNIDRRGIPTRVQLPTGQFKLTP